jgi:GNAT superfamily N-acetyltransferase
MPGGIRKPTRRDIPDILALAEATREEYQRYQRTFWRKAGDSLEKHQLFLERLLEDDHVQARIHETNGTIDAFVFASIMPAPPVYDPGGAVCLIDDFAAIDAAAWATAGAALLEAVTAEAKERGATLAVVIAGHLDQPKRAMLARTGYTIASEWHTREL